MSEPTSPPAPLEYATRPRWHRRRLARILFTTITCLALAAVAWLWGPAFWRRSMLLWQHQCMNYSPPADLIVYDQDSKGKSSLLSANTLYTSCFVTPREDQIPAINRNPNIIMPPNFLRSAALYPRCYRGFYGFGTGQLRFLPFMALLGPPIFMHEMHTPNGAHYLVVFHPKFYSDVLPFTDDHLALDCEVILPATWAAGPTRWLTINPNVFHSQTLADGKRLHIQVFAGQMDPNDPARFTVQYWVNGGPGSVEGRLLGDGTISVINHPPTIFAPATAHNHPLISR